MTKDITLFTAPNNAPLYKFLTKNSFRFRRNHGFLHLDITYSTTGRRRTVAHISFGNLDIVQV